MEKSKLYRPNKVKGAKTFNARKNRDELYDSDWSRYRVRFLSANPKCYSCGGKSSVVDHIKPHKGDLGLFTDLKNHLPSCKRCHDTVTALFDKNWSEENYTKKLEWINSMRIKFNVTIPVKVLGKYKK